MTIRTSIFGSVNLHCPLCGSALTLNKGKASEVRHTRFGYVCGKECFDRAELKYARMLLGKNDE